VEIIVRHTGGRTQALRLQDGPIYPLFDEVGSID
jgi:hypothetical protein